MDEQLASLTLRELLSGANGLALGFGLGGDALRSFGTHRPSIPVRNYVLITWHR